MCEQSAAVNEVRAPLGRQSDAVEAPDRCGWRLWQRVRQWVHIGNAAAGVDPRALRRMQPLDGSRPSCNSGAAAGVLRHSMAEIGLPLLTVAAVKSKGRVIARSLLDSD